MLERVFASFSWARAEEEGVSHHGRVLNGAAAEDARMALNRPARVPRHSLCRLLQQAGKNSRGESAVLAWKTAEPPGEGIRRGERLVARACLAALPLITGHSTSPLAGRSVFASPQVMRDAVVVKICRDHIRRRCAASPAAQRFPCWL